MGFISVFEYYSVDAYMVWSQKFRLTPSSFRWNISHFWKVLFGAL